MTGMVDIHCHVLPGVDDGAKTVEESVEMVRMLKEQGVDVIFATPHFRRRMFETPMDRINAAYEQLCREAAHLGTEIFLGCEFHANMDMEELFDQKFRPSMGGTPYVLVEFSGGDEYSYVRERLSAMLSRGWIPIIAHVERYPKVIKDLENVRELSELGARISVNADSILGKAGFSLKRICKKMIREDLIDMVGSDAHGVKGRIPRMKECSEYLSKKYGEEYTRRILCENPGKIIEERKG